jgi:starch phosphorylase
LHLALTIDDCAVTPRRWLDQCNPELSNLITKTLKVDKKVWLKDLTKLEGLLQFTEDAAFRKEWAAIKQRNKERLAHHVRTTLGFTVRTDAMFDVQIKRIHEYKVRVARGSRVEGLD